MKFQTLVASVLFTSSTFGAVIKREQFTQGQPIDDKGKGAPILGTPSTPSTPQISNVLTLHQQVELTVKSTSPIPPT
jgi:oxalate decarboxylase